MQIFLINTGVTVEQGSVAYPELQRLQQLSGKKDFQ